MKNKKILAILTISAIVSVAATGCSFGGDEPEEQVVVTETPAPEATATPTPEPTIAPDVQDSTYTSSNGAVSIKLPDATWSNKADEADMLSFESPEQGKILILHGQGEEDMSSAMLPDTQDLAVALEQASDLAEGTDFEIQDYTASDVEGVGVYSYTVEVHRCFRRAADMFMRSIKFIRALMSITISADLLWMRLLMQELRLQLIPSELQESLL
ncbi:MAG: hypothetical protein ACLURP_04950 [Ruminococcus sp.]